MKTDIQFQMNAEKPDDVLADLERKSGCASATLLGCRDKQLSERLGSVCVSGDVLTGAALVKYLNQMPTGDKESMLEDLALLKAWAIMEKNVPDEPKRVTAHPNAKLRDAGESGVEQH